MSLVDLDAERERRRPETIEDTMDGVPAPIVLVAACTLCGGDIVGNAYWSLETGMRHSECMGPVLA